MYTVTEKIPGSGYALYKFRSDKGESFKLKIANDFSENFSLEAGDAVSAGVVREALIYAEYTKAIAKALDILSYGNNSRKGVIDKLVTKYGFKKSTAEFAADYAVEKGYINEEDAVYRYALSAVRTKYRGKKRIIADLTAKGYEKNAVMSALDRIDKTEYYNSLVYYIKNKIGELPSEKDGMDKLTSKLVRMGHSFSDILMAYKELFDD